MLTDTQIGDLAGTAERLADAARETSLRWFRATRLSVDNKRDTAGAFDPVTAGDRETEAAIRDILARERPGDAILGEEQDEKTGETGLQWVIDPIDGTRAFLCGLPTWGVLIGLNEGGRPFLGVMDQPFTGERYTGVTAGARPQATLTRNGESYPLETRPCAEISDAVMCSTAPDAFASEQDAAVFAALSEACRLTRYGTDCYGYAMLASGHVDLVVESGLHAYDIQAMIPIVEAAGGIVTGWHGGDCAHGGRVVAAGDRALHAQAVAFLSAGVDA